MAHVTLVTRSSPSRPFFPQAAPHARHAQRRGHRVRAMDQGEDPPDPDADDPNSLLSLESPPQVGTGSSPTKRRRGDPGLIAAPQLAPSALPAPAEDPFASKLRSLSVATLRRILNDFGERSSGLRKEDLVSRVAAHGPDAVASLAPALIAPTAGLPAVPHPSIAPSPHDLVLAQTDAFAMPSDPDASASSPAAAAPQAKKSRRGGPRVGAGRKKKAASAATASPRPPLTDVIRLSSSPAAARATPARMQLTNSSSNSSPGGSNSLIISPPSFVLNTSHASHPELDGGEMDFSATASSDYEHLLQ